MFERFTDRARKALQHAQAEANRLNHMYVGTGHVLLGLVKEASGVAGTVLLRLGCDLAKTRSAVHQITPGDEDLVTLGRLPRSTNANLLIEYAIQFAIGRGDNFVGTEHLLLGLSRLPNSTGVLALQLLGVRADTVREGVYQFVPQLETEPTVQSLIDALQAVELAAAAEPDAATQQSLQLAADVLRQRVGQRQEELVVPLPNGAIRVGCLDWDDPDAIAGDYLAVDVVGGPVLVVTAADMVHTPAQATTGKLADLVQTLWLAIGETCPARPDQTAPPVHLLRWSLYHFVRWLSAAAVMRGVACNNSSWTHLTESGPPSSATTAS